MQGYDKVRKGVRDVRRRQLLAQRYRCTHCVYGLTGAVLAAFGAGIARMTLWRDVQAAGRVLAGRPVALRLSWV